MLRSPIDDVGLAAEERLEQPRDVAARVLIVGVGVDDEVGAELQAASMPARERRGQALPPAKPEHVSDAVRARDLRRAVRRAVVNHQDLDDVDARHGARQIGQRRAAACPPRSGRESG